MTGFIGQRLAIGALLALAASSAFAQATPAGKWQTIDDASGQPKAIIEIADDGSGQLSGKIIRGIGKLDQPEKRCTACKDERKDQLLKGMTIITGMRQSGDVWDGGQILDPENGKLYKCKMTLEDGGQKLVVRGYIGVSLLGRSQTWIREQ
ncbi:DUF2147 domain-containing protein [Caballeronia sp. BR00000012568055]|uniref:DUF2147 domain-containing protein n=1 Tax=Caballeronia sp. BR00000012568055 TaxID=2918761 RepID=UPI0023F7C181|nr:DUF2147 domain-containing protein [Caballeronia sp. BR00000012568055]